MRSLYGAARLDASFCCFCERALALSELRLFPCPVFPFALSLDVRRRIARERVPVAIETGLEHGGYVSQAYSGPRSVNGWSANFRYSRMASEQASESVVSAYTILE
jgi:hypothetical protein